MAFHTLVRIKLLSIIVTEMFLKFNSLLAVQIFLKFLVLDTQGLGSVEEQVRCQVVSLRLRGHEGAGAATVEGALGRQ